MLVLKPTQKTAAVVRPLRLVVTLGLFCLLLFTGCNPTQKKAHEQSML